MPADRIDRGSSLSAESARLQCEGKGQAEFSGAIVTGGHPLGAQTGHGLGGEAAAASHDCLSIAQTQENILPLLNGGLVVKDREQGI